MSRKTDVREGMAKLAAVAAGMEAMKRHQREVLAKLDYGNDLPIVL